MGCIIKIDDTALDGYVCVLSDITSLYRLNTLKSHVIRMASHDLRSPVTSLGLQHYLLKKQISPLTPNILKVLDRMDSNIVDMARMIEDLLNLDYIERQAMGKREQIALGSLLNSAVSMLSPQIQTKSHQLSIEIADDLPLIFGDEVGLLEAVGNYLTNAVKYTPDGGSIVLTAYGCEDKIYVEVRDNGIGIDEVDLRNVYVAHFRAQTALANSENGTGIGLSLVKSIIEDHGGEVWVRSQVGVGSTFGFSLPVDSSYSGKPLTSISSTHV